MWYTTRPELKNPKWWRAARAAVWYRKAWVRDGRRSWGDLVFIWKSCLMSVSHGLRLKAAPSNEREKKRLKNICYTCSRSKDKMPRTRKKNCISKVHSSTKPAPCGLSHYAFTLNLCHLGDWFLLKIMLLPTCMPTMHSYIPKYAGNKSVFCSTVTAQTKPWEEIVGPNVTTRPRLKAKYGRSCTTLCWKKPIICVGLVCANKQHSLEFPTDRPGIHLKK